MTDDSEKTSVCCTTGAGSTTVKSEMDARVKDKMEILDFLSNNTKIYFKSQQIDDPELTSNEKKLIATDILNKSEKSFLLRFGKFLEERHLKYFAENSTSTDEELQYIIHELQENLQRRPHDIKNRRYAALKAMIAENNYFSETEMMKREPHLYEQLIGQYLTDSEKRLRDCPEGIVDTPFSEILLENYDKEQLEQLRKKQERDDISDNSSQCSLEDQENSQETINDELYPKTPFSYRKHWGNFEDEEDSNVPPATSATKKITKQQKYISAGEREILRQEFMGIMYAKFLEGDDKEFDYTKVDDDADLDDLEQIGRDNEDKYFDEDEDDDDIDIRNERIDEVSSDDELDVYMKHLIES